jgi:predicted AAA+ superfamily ATPase
MRKGVKKCIAEDDIIVSRKTVPEIWYINSNGQKKRYFVDCFIKSENKCIEVKSTWTLEKKKNDILLKQQAVKDAGYKCEIWVYNRKGNIVEKYE